MAQTFLQARQPWPYIYLTFKLHQYLLSNTHYVGLILKTHFISKRSPWYWKYEGKNKFEEWFLVDCVKIHMNHWAYFIQHTCTTTTHFHEDTCWPLPPILRQHYIFPMNLHPILMTIKLQVSLWMIFYKIIWIVKHLYNATYMHNCTTSSSGIPP